MSAAWALVMFLMSRFGNEFARRLGLRGIAGHLRLLGEPLLDLRMGDPRLAAGAVDQTGAEPFGIVEQDLEEMAGRELRMALADGEILRGLDEAPGALGVFLEIHAVCPSPDRRVPRPLPRHGASDALPRGVGPAGTPTQS